MEINYNNPIFIWYINTTHISAYEVSNITKYVKEQVKNFQLIILPNSEKTSMEILWKGKYEEGQEKFVMKKSIEDILYIIDGHITNDSLKTKIRDLVLKQLE